MKITSLSRIKISNFFSTRKTKTKEGNLIDQFARCVYLEVAVYKGVREFIFNPYRATSDPPPC